MHADGVSEAKRYAAGDNEEKEGAPGQKHWPKGDGQESHRADPERLRRAPAHLAVEGIGFVVHENAFRAGHQLHATRFAPIEDALGGCARLACMSIRRDSNADAAQARPQRGVPAARSHRASGIQGAGVLQRRLAFDELAMQHVLATSLAEHGPIGRKMRKIPISNITHVQSAKYLWERRFRSSLREAIVARGGIRVTLAPGRAGQKMPANGGCEMPGVKRERDDSVGVLTLG